MNRRFLRLQAQKLGRIQMSVYSWGCNRFGALGSGVAQNVQLEPVLVDNLNFDNQFACQTACGILNLLCYLMYGYIIKRNNSLFIPN